MRLRFALVAASLLVIIVVVVMANQSRPVESISGAWRDLEGVDSI